MIGSLNRHRGSYSRGFAGGSVHLGCRVEFTGYLAGREDLARKLLVPDPRTANAEELVARAYRKWGSGLQTHLLGEYAVAIIDTMSGNGLVTHDALGLVPLFYVIGPDDVRFATRLCDLLDDETLDAADATYLPDFMARGLLSTDRTPYAAVRRLLPGQSLVVNSGRVTVERTWRLTDAPIVSERGDDELEERFRELIAAAVHGALDPGKPTMISLSGGLDSSSIASVAAGAPGAAIEAYSVVAPLCPEANEAPWMEAVVEHYPMPWHRIDVDSVLPFGRLPETYLGEPTPAVLTEGHLATQNAIMRERGSAVLLSGHGGDSVLAAFAGAVPIHLADPIFEGRPLKALRGLGRWRRDAREDRSLSYWISRGLLQPTIDHLRGRRAGAGNRTEAAPSWLRDDFIYEMDLSRRGQHSVGERCRQPGRQAMADQLHLLGCATALNPRYKMAFSVRHPLLYRPLVEFMFGVPWDKKIRPRCDRLLQRRALKNILPEKVRRRASKGVATGALVEGLRRSPPWIDYLCDDPFLARQGIVDAEHWRSAIRRASVGHTEDDKYLTAAIAVEVWLRKTAELRCSPQRQRSNGQTEARIAAGAPASGAA